jgi:hypothetical protein
LPVDQRRGIQPRQAEDVQPLAVDLDPIVLIGDLFNPDVAGEQFGRPF